MFVNQASNITIGTPVPIGTAVRGSTSTVVQTFLSATVLLVVCRRSKGPNNGGHVANEPMAFCTNSLRVLKGLAHPVHANPSRPLVALLVRAKN